MRRLRCSLAWGVALCALFALSCGAAQRGPACIPGYALMPSGSCEPDEQCHPTDECRTRGMCTTWGDQCVVASERDCVQSENCRNFGACALVVQHASYQVGTCRASADGCAASTACADYGRCTLDRSSGTCVVGGDEDCANARICRDEKKCTAARFQKADGCRSSVLACQFIP
ncbi:MAG: hypothetical protein M0R76_04400 [Proteobacteria bacterium]|nr:hypothetical protein [Pseudomonadota bacterium]